MKTLGTLIEILAQEARAFINSERESIISAKILATNAATAEITHLREQNELLLRLLQSENAKSEKAKDDLIQRVSSLLGEFTAARDESLRAAVSQVSDRNLEAEANITKFESDHGQIMDSMVSSGKASHTVFDRKSKEGKRTRDGALKVDIPLYCPICCLTFTIALSYGTNCVQRGYGQHGKLYFRFNEHAFNTDPRAITNIEPDMFKW